MKNGNLIWNGADEDVLVLNGAEWYCNYQYDSGGGVMAGYS